jgi:hypothetical protein
MVNKKHLKYISLLSLLRLSILIAKLPTGQKMMMEKASPSFNNIFTG